VSAAEEFSEGERATIIEKCNRMLGTNSTLDVERPAELLEAVEQGDLFARLVIAVDREALDERAINVTGGNLQRLSDEQALQNHSLPSSCCARAASSRWC